MYTSCMPSSASADEDGCVWTPNNKLCNDDEGCTVDTCKPLLYNATIEKGSCIHLVDQNPIDVLLNKKIECLKKEFLDIQTKEEDEKSIRIRDLEDMLHHEQKAREKERADQQAARAAEAAAKKDGGK